MKVIGEGKIKWRIKEDVYLVMDIQDAKPSIYISDENNGIGIRLKLTELGDLQESIEELLAMTVTDIAKLRENLERE